MSLKDSISSFPQELRIKSYSSLTFEERKEIASCDGLIDSIKMLRKLLNRTDETNRNNLANDKLFCEELRGAFLMRCLR